MKTKLHVRALSALVLAALILTGCGGGNPFRLIFPRIFVEVDKEGFPHRRRHQPRDAELLRRGSQPIKD